MGVIIINPFALDTGGGGGGYTPPAITSANYVMWCEARHLSLANDDPVSEFTNQVSSNHWTGSGTTRPLFKTNVLNGEPVLRFDGSDDYLVLATDILSGKSAGEVFIVLKVDNDPPGASAQSGLWTMTSVDSDAAHYPFTSGNIFDHWGSNARKDTGNPTPSLASFHLYNVSSAAGNWTSRINGTQHFTTATNTFASFTADPKIWLGRSSSGFGDVYLDGDVAAIVIVDAVLNSTDRDAIENELATVYGLTVA